MSLSRERREPDENRDRGAGLNAWAPENQRTITTSSVARRGDPDVRELEPHRPLAEAAGRLTRDESARLERHGWSGVFALQLSRQLDQDDIRVLSHGD